MLTPRDLNSCDCNAPDFAAQRHRGVVVFGEKSNLR
jgi:hypothetical protein